MNKSYMKIIPLLKIINNSIFTLPTPINISLWWNFGSLLGVILMFQIITGVFLSMHYSPNTLLAFNSIIHIIQDVNNGWIFRLMHMNGASMFFLCMYIHIGRGMYYGLYNLMSPWILGTLIFLISMSTAFMGYVLPWGQMSFWGATVITNLISTIPYIGQTMLTYIWGGFSVSAPTLNRFFSIHFILPFMILLMVVIHLMFIHETGSSNPMGINSNMLKIPFNSYFTLKDIYGIFLTIMILMLLSLMSPYLISDPENFMLANPMITPIHIQPEWYFLFAYTILRSIPNKLGGVLMLLMSILILLILPFLKLNLMKSLKFYPISQMIYWSFINTILILTWLGMSPVEPPFITISQIFTILYFSYYMLNNLIMKLWDLIIK